MGSALETVAQQFVLTENFLQKSVKNVSVIPLNGLIGLERVMEGLTLAFLNFFYIDIIYQSHGITLHYFLSF